MEFVYSAFTGRRFYVKYA